MKNPGARVRRSPKPARDTTAKQRRERAAGVDRIAAARQMLENAGAASELLKALANAHRLRVLCLLAGGELSVGAINEAIDLSQSALSQHLAVLRANGLVKVRRDSQTMYYSLDGGPVQDIIDVLHRTYCAQPSIGPICGRTASRP